jgi:oligopeptide/dipeptide ABC transporter ATP-binding protein
MNLLLVILNIKRWMKSNSWKQKSVLSMSFKRTVQDFRGISTGHIDTLLLIQSLPVLGNKGVFMGIPGITPSLLDVPPGCVFHPRCPYAMDICRVEIPELELVRPERWIACHLHGEIK